MPCVLRHARQRTTFFRLHSLTSKTFHAVRFPKSTHFKDAAAARSIRQKMGLRFDYEVVDVPPNPIGRPDQWPAMGEPRWSPDDATA